MAKDLELGPDILFVFSSKHEQKGFDIRWEFVPVLLRSLTMTQAQFTQNRRRINKGKTIGSVAEKLPAGSWWISAKLVVQTQFQSSCMITTRARLLAAGSSQMVEFGWGKRRKALANQYSTPISDSVLYSCFLLFL